MLMLLFIGKRENFLVRQGDSLQVLCQYKDDALLFRCEGISRLCDLSPSSLPCHSESMIFTQSLVLMEGSRDHTSQANGDALANSRSYDSLATNGHAQYPVIQCGFPRPPPARSPSLPLSQHSAAPSAGDGTSDTVEETITSGSVMDPAIEDPQIIQPQGKEDVAMEATTSQTTQTTMSTPSQTTTPQTNGGGDTPCTGAKTPFTPSPTRPNPTNPSNTTTFNNGVVTNGNHGYTTGNYGSDVPVNHSKVPIPAGGDHTPQASPGGLPLALIRPTYFLDRPELGRLNDIDFNQAYVSALARVFQSLGAGGDLTLLDITRGVSLLPLQALKLGASEVCLVGQNPHTQSLLTDIANTNAIPTAGLFFEGHDFEYFESNWSVLVTELVEPCGCLRQQVLEDIVLARCVSMCKVSTSATNESPCTHIRKAIK